MLPPPDQRIQLPPRLGVDERLAFMVDEKVAQQRPPDSVKTCPQYSSWLLQQEAAPVGPFLTYVATIRAYKSVDVRIDNIFAIRDRSKAIQSSSSGRSVQVRCVNPGQNDHSTRLQSADKNIPIISAYDNIKESETDTFNVNRVRSLEGNDDDIRAGQAVSVSFVVDPGLELGVYSYSIYMRVAVSGDSMVLPVYGAGHDFKCCEWPMGKGFRATTYEWTPNARWTLRYCKESHYEGDPPPPDCIQRIS